MFVVVELKDEDRSREPMVEFAAMEVGLCTDCRHAKVLRNDRGSTFYFCSLAEKDPKFRRFPPLPVRQCPGYDKKMDGTRGQGFPPC